MSKLCNFEALFSVLIYTKPLKKSLILPLSRVIKEMILVDRGNTFQSLVGLGVAAGLE